MSDIFPVLRMSYEQIALLTAQLLVYQQYLQRQNAASVKRNRTLRVLAALLQRLGSVVGHSNAQTALFLTVEEVRTMKKALTVLRSVLESKSVSVGREQEIQRLVAMKKLIDQTFPDIQSE